jgi:hypothetical protein
MIGRSLNEVVEAAGIVGSSNAIRRYRLETGSFGSVLYRQQRTIRTLPIAFELGSTRRMMLKRPINCTYGKLSDRVLDGDWQLEKRSESCERVS